MVLMDNMLLLFFLGLIESTGENTLLLFLKALVTLFSEVGKLSLEFSDLGLKLFLLKGW